MKRAIMSETRPDGSVNTYSLDSASLGGLTIQQNRYGASKSSKKFMNVLRDMFLPQGYPQSVSSDYLEYQIWDTLQALCSSLSGTLATYATFEGLGVGRKDASVASATYIYILKSSTDMMGSILFAYLKSSSLDAQCRQWRLFADIMNDLAIFLSILSPNFQGTGFVVISCMSSFVHALVSVAGNTTRAALRVHQSRSSNMADVSAKDNSQEQMVNLTGLFISFTITAMISFGQMFIWTVFLLAMVFHLYFNYRAVKCIRMESLNPSRLYTLVERFTYFGSGADLSIDSVNIVEPAFVWSLSSLPEINLGSSMASFKTMCRSADGSFIYGVDESGKLKGAIQQGSSDVQILEAYFCLLSYKMKYPAPTASLSIFEQELPMYNKDFDNFRMCLIDNKWVLETSLLMVDSWRFSSEVSSDIQC